MKPPQGKKRLDIRFAVLCLACTLVASLLGFWATWPIGPAVQQLRLLGQRQGVDIELSQAGRLYPLGLRADKIILRPTGLPFPLELTRLEIRPLWTALLRGRPAVAINSEIWQGRLTAEMGSDGHLSLQLNDLHLAYDLRPRLPLSLGGRLAAAAFDGQLPPDGRNKGKLKVKLDNIRISGLKNFGIEQDGLRLGTIELTAETVGGTLRLHKLEARGGELEAEATGSLQLASRPEHSRLALNVRLQAREDLAPAVRSLLDLLGKPGRDGSRRLRLSGTLAAPQVR